jgi:hypothetical protein
MRYGKAVLLQWLQRAFLVFVGACGLWVGASGCKGSEHVVLAPILQQAGNPSGGSGGGGAGGSSPVDGGNSQSMDASDPEPDAGNPPIDSGLNPNVTFDWTETLPGPGECGPNMFVGSFSCTSPSRLTPFVGQMTVIVSDMRIGESLLVVSGKLADAAGFELFFSANIAGSLNCGDNLLTANTTDGRAAYFGVEATFQTEIEGEYDRQTLEMVGQITLVITYDDPMMTEVETCRGSFQVGAPL